MSAPLTLDDVLRLREEIGARPPSVKPARDERFHDAAALVTSFALDPAIHTGAAAVNLIADSVAANAGRDGRWSLRNDVRRRVLGRLGTVERLRAALLANPSRPADPVQLVIDEWLLAEPKPLESQLPEKLSATLQVTDWFSDTELAGRLPSAESVRVRVEYEAFVQPLRSLVGTHFRGRSVELAALETYAGDPAQTASLRERFPLLIFGPGGIGKSTLAAKFLLGHLGHLPVIYLDCDRPGLAPAEPITFLAEAVYQLGLQFPDCFGSACNLRERWLRGIAAAREEQREGQVSMTLGRVGILQDFRAFVKDLNLRERTIVLVVDTFEEIYARSRAYVQETFEFLDELQALLPKLRTILVGRHPIPDFSWEPLELSALDAEAAEAFLGTLDVGPAPLRRRLAGLLRGNPLTLRLGAAVVAGKGEPVDLEELEAISDDTEIQGYLYRRILGHVQEEVRALAHPGLILRRITPDLIRKVLASPCGVPVPDDAEARRLFDLLEKELSLVVPEGDAVRHRSDVRRVMLRPLKKDQPAKVSAIEAAAIEYYAPATDLVSRAEEIYHRLSLGQPLDRVEERWLPGIEGALHGAVEELAGEARSYLASRLQIEIYDENWDGVDQAVWERHIEKLARELLQLDRPLDALRALRRRSSRLPQSSLFWLEAQALHRNGQTLEAREVARRGLAQLLGEPESWSGKDVTPSEIGISRAVATALMAWYAGPEVAGPPTAAEARLRIAYLELLQPLRARAYKEFAGRARELETLRSYVMGGGLVIDLSERPPLLIHGPGGLGKSSLVAKFLLDRLPSGPFVYLDSARFERGEPTAVSLLAEAARQLAIQYPGSYPGVRVELDRWRPDMSPEETLHNGKNLFDRLLARWLPKNQKILFFLDNFEAWNSGLAHAYEMLAWLQGLLPLLRTVVVSRDEMPELKFERMRIGPLDRESADAFLVASGIAPSEIRGPLIQLVAGNPFALRLSVDAIRLGGPAALARLRAAPDRLPEYLFGRLAGHVDDSDHRRLLSGALLLRRIDPPLVEALVRTLSLQYEGDIDPARLLEFLRAQEMFFTWDGRALRVRADVRRIVRQPLRQALGESASRVDEAAVCYYEARPDFGANPEDRAEEIYHRLTLRQPSELIDARWMPGVEEALRGAVDELDGVPRLYLASRLGIALADAEWKDADQATWELFAARQVRKLLNQGRLFEALELLDERSTRLPQSPLFALHAETFFYLERYRDALEIARTGLQRWPNDPALPSILARSEAILGVAESTSTEPTPIAHRRAADNFVLRENFEVSQLWRALTEALSNSTDLVNVLRSSGTDPSLFRVGGNVLLHDVLLEVIAWGQRTGRLEAFLMNVLEQYPDADALRRFVAENGAQLAPSKTTDPFEAVLLPGGQLFCNRLVLRQFLRRMSAPNAPRRHCLIVNGPPGSGKSYTATLVAYVAATTSRFRLVMLHNADCDLSKFLDEIYAGFGWRRERAEDSDFITDQHRITREAQAIGARARESRVALLLLVDCGQAGDLPTLQFVHKMLENNNSAMSLILLDYDRPVPAGAWLYSTSEVLEELSAEDLIDAFTSLVSQGLLPQLDRLPNVVANLLLDIESGPDKNACINRAFRETLLAAGTGK